MKLEDVSHMEELQAELWAGLQHLSNKSQWKMYIKYLYTIMIMHGYAF